jgi:hypothetical protein
MASLIFNPKLSLHLCEYYQSAARARSKVRPVRSSMPRLLIHSQSRKRSAVYPPRALSLRHAKAIHLIRVSATSLTISITITATCAVPDVGDHIGAVGRCLAEVSYLRRPSAWATLSSSVCPAVSNTAGSSQVRRFPLSPLPFLRLSSSSLTLRQLLAPSIHQTSDALLVCGGEDICMYSDPRSY